MIASRRIRVFAGSLLLGVAGSAFALDTVSIAASSLSLNCLEYRVVGICYWLQCGLGGCSVRTSVKVRHYIPDAVVSSYANTGENPWTEVRLLSMPNPTARGGGDGTTNQSNENNLAKFRNADVIGHPAGAAFGKFAASAGYTCQGAGTPLMPYLLSTLDTVAWRYNLPELVYPESLVPGMREIGGRLTANLWGNVYPRGGLLHQVDDHKASAVVAQRAGDIVTRRGQPHVYQPLLASKKQGYWPAGPLVESKASTGKWQELTPRMSNTCTVFPNTNFLTQAKRGDYAWALWRPYSCCKRRGQKFLGSTDFQ
ncbi:TIGR03756 family integrating conjugative element protein [Pseudomonas chlororaphis]|uniref:TIGR03756 family integrating conjugative element protein n=1 Tax=Pseudomonas chlororaphis TaxID=587753 RepID=UPI00046E5460|nr:TIGR03756 family integrating conjugative element protein [Pseudomonas chlororaphis]